VDSKRTISKDFFSNWKAIPVVALWLYPHKAETFNLKMIFIAFTFAA
jgi:hypothetical protein